MSNIPITPVLDDAEPDVFANNRKALESLAASQPHHRQVRRPFIESLGLFVFGGLTVAAAMIGRDLLFASRGRRFSRRLRRLVRR
ncbi:hypothetical protein [Labilithrix luteola]|nr:hypothetical protein [Labilithrix luteola]